jgi:N-acetylglucosaminyldiphosphoundecaprenol N-acetyl-beta-D-mannosaminyltransferase
VTDTASDPDPALREPLPAVDVLGVRVHRVTLSEALAHVLELARGNGRDLVMTPNADHVVRLQRDAEFRDVYRHASLVLADGMSVVWAARILGTPLPERVAGSDLMPALCEAAARAGLRYYFVGGAPGDAEKAAAVLARRAGSDGCAGVDCPPFGFERDAAYVDGLVQRITQARPHIVCVGLGSPKQERLMVAIRDRLPGVGVLLGVGVTFSFVAGTIRRAPPLLRKIGLEWAWRLLSEPRRLWRRYLDNLLHMPWLVLKARLARRRERAHGGG